MMEVILLNHPIGSRQALKVVNGTGTWERLGEVAKVY